MPLARLPVPACASHADRADRESHEISIAIAIPIAMNRGGESVPGTWMDGMNADDARKMRVRF